MKGSEWLQKETENNGNISIWPASQDKNTDNVIVLEPNMRCPCNKRVGFMYQCKHDYLVDTKINIDKYDNRWYNNHAFHEIHGVFIYPTADITMLNRSEFVIHDEIIINSNEGSDGCNHYDQFEECGIDLHSVETLNDGDKITYQELMSRFTELARTVQNNQTICASVIGTVNKMISLHRSNTHFNVDIVTTNTMDTHAVDAIGKIRLIHYRFQQ